MKKKEFNRLIRGMTTRELEHFVDELKSALNLFEQARGNPHCKINAARVGDKEYAVQYDGNRFNAGNYKYLKRKLAATLTIAKERGFHGY